MFSAQKVRRDRERIDVQERSTTKGKVRFDLSPREIRSTPDVCIALEQRDRHEERSIEKTTSRTVSHAKQSQRRGSQSKPGQRLKTSFSQSTTANDDDLVHKLESTNIDPPIMRDGRADFGAYLSQVGNQSTVSLSDTSQIDQSSAERQGSQDSCANPQVFSPSDTNTYSTVTNQSQFPSYSGSDPSAPMSPPQSPNSYLPDGRSTFESLAGSRMSQTQDTSSFVPNPVGETSGGLGGKGYPIKGTGPGGDNLDPRK
jgi:hypothetical protein